MSRISMYEKIRRFVESQSEGQWDPALVKRDTDRLFEMFEKEKKSAKRVPKPKPEAAPKATEAEATHDVTWHPPALMPPSEEVYYPDQQKIAARQAAMYGNDFASMSREEKLEAISRRDPMWNDSNHAHNGEHSKEAEMSDIERKFMDDALDDDDENVDTGNIENEPGIEDSNAVKHTPLDEFGNATPVEAPYFLPDKKFVAPEKKRGGFRQEKFPFSTMAVGDQFVIPATAAKPEPWKSYQSTVSGAQRRFADVVGMKLKTNTDGTTKEIEDLRYTKRFTIFRAVADDGTVVAVVERTA